MSKFYGQVCEDGGKTTTASRRGYHNIRASAQAYDGSLIAIAEDDGDGVRFRLQVDREGSSNMGRTVFCGTLDELIERLVDSGIWEG